MSTAAPKKEMKVEDLTVNITEEIHVKAGLEATFAALLEEMGEANTADGKPMPMKIEPWPGGRWYRDLGDNNGHLWGHVQAIKRPTLLEISGPLFMSYAAISNLQYRLSEKNGGTLIQFRHNALGFVTEHHRGGMEKGWKSINERVRLAAEKKTAN